MKDTAAPYRTIKSLNMVRFFNLIEDDDVVVELLSFLDFGAAVRTGRMQRGARSP